MNAVERIRRLGVEVVTAFQFLARVFRCRRWRSQLIPCRGPSSSFRSWDWLSGLGAVLLQKLLLSHLSRPLVALVVLIYFVLITGCFHEDGLADTSDGFGGGWNRDEILAILKDSRIGSYGATALVVSLLARYLLLASLPLEHFAAYVISAHVLCRWSSLPLSYFLAPAGEQGQGARIAKLTSLSSLTFGSVFSLAIVVFALRVGRAVAPLLVTMLAVALSGWFYFRKIGGVTGDCFGATNQLAEIAVYCCCGVWNV